MSDPVQDPSLDIAKQAEAVATAKVEELKQSLISSIAGQPPETPPKAWSEVARKEDIDTAVTTAVQKAEERVFQKLEAEKKSLEAQQAEQEKLTAAQQEAANNREWEEMSAQWREAVADGVMPDISPEVKAKLNAKIALTPEDQEDQRLKAYNEARALHIQLKKEGKSSSFTRTMEKFYNKQPSGAQAPVLGSHVQVDTNKGLTYAEVQANRRKVFGF